MVKSRKNNSPMTSAQWSDDTKNAMLELRSALIDRLKLGPDARLQKELEQVERVVKPFSEVKPKGQKLKVVKPTLK
jgi:gamma-glutamyl phosphate reductase